MGLLLSRMKSNPTMPPFPSFAERVKAKRIRRIAAVCFASASLLSIAFATESIALGQVPSDSSSAQSGGQSATDNAASVANSGDSGDTGALGGSLSASGNGSTPAALSSDQIIGILQNNPDLLAPRHDPSSCREAQSHRCAEFLEGFGFRSRLADHLR